MNPHRCAKFDALHAIISVAIGCVLATPFAASQQDAPFPCENWGAPRQTVVSQALFNHLKREAEGGKAAAWYELAMIDKLSGQEATLDLNFRQNALEQAAELGHKGAIARLARQKHDLKQIQTDTYVNLLVDAAESRDRDAARILRDAALGRTLFIASALSQSTLIKRSDTRRYAELGAKSGDPVAAGFMCAQLRSGDATDIGFEKDDNAAFEWCMVAVTYSCNDASLLDLAALVRAGRGTRKSEALAERLLERWLTENPSPRVLYRK